MWFICGNCGAYVCEEVRTQTGPYFCCVCRPQSNVTRRGEGKSMKLAVKHFSLALFAFICLLGLFVLDGYSQTECPADKVCISPAAARQALVDSDTVKAQQTQIAAQDQAIADLKTELNNMRVRFAEVSGEATALRQNAVSDRAIITVLLQSVRPKKIGLINLF